jgi:hypothetical protein
MRRIVVVTGGSERGAASQLLIECIPPEFILVAPPTDDLEGRRAMDSAINGLRSSSETDAGDLNPHVLPG